MRRLLPLLFVFSTVRAQDKVITYKESAEDFLNPERGFYIPMGASASHFTPLDSAGLGQLFAPGQKHGKARYAIYSTLLMREYTLDSFRTRPISQDFLNKIDRDLDVVRKAGLKVILRMAYTNTQHSGDCPDEYKICPPYGDAPKAVVLEHIRQLAPLFRKHADVIAVVQEGFIGIWGENFYTDYFGDPGGNGPGRVMDSSWRDRNEVLHALLDALPKDRMVQVRTPQIKQKYVYGAHADVDSRPLSPQDGFSAADAARIGHHNDCFLSSPDDYGTYYDYGSSVSAKKPANDILRKYVADDSRYVPMGGETCDDTYSPQNDCAPAGHAEEEIASLHVSFLNSAYNNDVNNDWDSLGCMSSIRQRMGYRFVLKEARLPDHVVAGGSFTIDIKLRNAGYASPYNPRVVQLVMRDRASGREVAIPCKVDVRRWYSGDVVWKETVELPRDLGPGSYEVLLAMPDPYASLAGKPAYSIRLANEDCWEAGTGYNDLHAVIQVAPAQAAPIVPSAEQLDQPFGEQDKTAFMSPAKVYYPETWFHFIGGNVSKQGITADLEAIARAGISGIQLFHGQFGGPWPGVSPQIACLSPLWEDAIQHTAKECRRLGLRFTMQNCPGWAMSGGPWITPSNAMRHLAWGRADVEGGKGVINMHLDQPQPSSEPWRDYKDLMVLAFPTPLDDTGSPVTPQSVKGSDNIAWASCFVTPAKESVHLTPAAAGKPYWVEVSFANPVTIRTIEFPSVNSMGHAWNYEPGVQIRAQAILANGEAKEILNTTVPAANFQDHSLLSFACEEVKGAKKIRISIANKHDMALGFIRMYSAARENNWESEAGWTLRNIDRSGKKYIQSSKSYIYPARIVDISKMMDAQGNLSWDAPAGKWTVLRIGHVNSGKQNGPAPPEGTGWECNKLSETGANAHFAGYIGRLSGADGVLGGGLLNGMLMDSWECETQTWTENMEAEFDRMEAYLLRNWIPALFGYVLKDQETTFRFLRDWRETINDLYTHNFYGRMSALAKQNNLAVSYETAAGDVFPADILEYYKFADVPMCEFWQPFTNGFVGSLNFKPIKPAASAARIYGKRRLGAEAFTSFDLTWDEHWRDLKEVANINSVEGVTHLIFHTYTHNPRADSLKPGTSFGAHIGTPFLRQQTWWRHMPQLTTYLARTSYMLERGRPVSDVLWYLGDEIDHKPDQNAPFPEGFKYDYCNPDVLLHRLSVENGMLVTPEGIRYRVLWMPVTTHMLPETLEKLRRLIHAGATVVGHRPQMIATLSGGADAEKRFNQVINDIWGAAGTVGTRRLGKGVLVSGPANLSKALAELHIAPDVTGGDALWTHRSVEGADWYYVTSPKGRSFKGALNFRNTGSVEIWDPVTGGTQAVAGEQKGGRTTVAMDLPKAGSCFVVFYHNDVAHAAPVQAKTQSTVKITAPWDLSFPEGWGAPRSMQLNQLKPWKDLDMSDEAKAFSGTGTYTTIFEVGQVAVGAHYSINLGEVDMIAKVMVNGRELGTLWCEPYQVDITDAVVPGKNLLTIEVTSTWFNRLAYDAGVAEDKRKTWTIDGPEKGSPLRKSGLMGPVTIHVQQTLSAQVPIVSTRQGVIKGVNESGIAVFKGIPYAQPPVGGLRYQPPVSHQPWRDTLNAVEFASAASQPSGEGASGSEDCLYLNLYTPAADSHKRPVVIWIHGGSMTSGSGKGMDGHAFADKDDIVTITINYRLGALGFLYLGDLGPKYRQTGDLGLLDVIAALQWVHDNVAAFGGDPGRVTVMGESAGAKLLSAVMVSPASKGLYQQAILESGAVQCIRDSGTAKRARGLLMKELGIKDARELLTLPAEALIKAQAKVCEGIGGNSFFGPVYDGVTIPEDGYQYAREGKLSGIRAIIGTNENEGATFIWKPDIGQDPNPGILQPLFRSNAPMANAYYQTQLKTDSPFAALVRTMTQYMYQMHSYRFAKALTGAGTPVYLYRYRYQNGRAFGAHHGDELHYIWGAAHIAASNDDETKKALARNLHGAWVAFIKTGDPNGGQLLQWPAYKDTDRQVMVFDEADAVTRLNEVYDDKLFPSAVFVIK